jgi:histone-lysine N-methyltransferase SETMAR
LIENAQQKGQELWCNHSWLLHHDNVPTHMSVKSTELVTNNNKVIIPHPPFSLDLGPCDFVLFPTLKMKLKGWRFETLSDIQRQLQAILDRIKEYNFHSACEVWKKWWDHCIHCQGDYVGGDGSQNWVSYARISFLI